MKKLKTVRSSVLCWLLLFCPGLPPSTLLAQSPDIPDLSKFEDDIRHWGQEPSRDFPYDRLAPTEVRAIADNMLMMQNPDGGWPKNVDWLAKLDHDTIWNHLTDHEQPSTCDNRNTYSHIEYLSRVYAILRDEKYRQAADRGLGFLLHTQRETGGWRGADVDAITFNDDLMPGVMNLLQDILEGRPYFSWIRSTMKDSLRNALDRAIAATLRCQIVVNGQKTAWSQQHDNMTFEPVKARSYELPSIVSLESVTIVEFLMRLKNPGLEVQEAVMGAVRWMQRSSIHGIKLEFVVSDSLRPLSRNRRRRDVRVVPDSGAAPLWARYYEIDTNRPFFCNRDGKKVYSLAEVLPERRAGYAWYGDWPERLIQQEYPEWVDRIRRSVPRDTSFTLYQAFTQEKDRFPFIRFAQSVLPAGVDVQRNIVYASYGVHDLHLDVFRLPDSSIRPSVILIHGGAWNSGSKELAHPMAQQLAARGFVAVAVEYRLSTEAPYPAAVRDIRAAIAWVRTHARELNIDAHHLALYGTSAGGQLAALVGTTLEDTLFRTGTVTMDASSAVQAIVDVDGVLDMTTPEESNPRAIPAPAERWLGFPYADRPDLWREASALNHVSATTPPIFFLNSSNERFHAGRDRMIEKLNRFGIISEVQTLPDTPHPFWLFEPWFSPTVRFTADVLSRTLATAK